MSAILETAALRLHGLPECAGSDLEACRAMVRTVLESVRACPWDGFTLDVPAAEGQPAARLIVSAEAARKLWASMVGGLLDDDPDRPASGG